MSEKLIQIREEDINKIIIDIEFIKERLSELTDEGELTDWAKEELQNARKIPLSECISLKEMKKKLSIK